MATRTVHSRSAWVMCLLLLVIVKQTQGLWFTAYAASEKKPFCFVDYMTEENDYLIKWYTDPSTPTEESSSSSETVSKSSDDTTEKKGGKGKKDKSTKVKDDTPEPTENLLYFNITTFDPEQVQKESNGTATTPSKKGPQNHFYSTENAEDRAKGSFHFAIDHSTTLVNS